MTVEWLMAGLLLAAVMVSLGRQLHSTLGWLTMAGLFSLSMGAVGWRHSQVRQNEQARAKLAEKVPREARPGGYVRSDNCQSCHPGPYASWHRSFHRTMTQLPSREAVRGKFDGVTLTLGGEGYRLEQHGDEYWVEMVDPDWKYVRQLKQAAYRAGRTAAAPAEESHPPRVRKRITLLTGSHHMQAYWVPSDFGNMQFSFPFTYLFADERWVPRNATFVRPPELAHRTEVWNVICSRCHATGIEPRVDARARAPG